jgi:pimeloyl-ACP methyl ester carboxylesterase
MRPIAVEQWLNCGTTVRFGCEEETMLHNLAQALADNPALARRNRFARLVIAVGAGEERFTVRLGVEPIGVERGVSATPDIELKASRDAWAEFARPVPAVGYQSLHGMMRLGHLQVTGNMLELGRHLILIEDVFSHMRGTVGAPVAAAPVGRPWIEPVTGRYLHADIDGRPHRIYFEEAGAADGIPLVCLHTAGSDGRQYRAVLTDPGITETFRVIVFDLPWHGKSSPPPGFEREVYRLTTRLYVDTVMTVVGALGLERPVVMGCSIGGRAVLHLALHHGATFRAAIGLQSALHADPDANPALRELELIHRPDVHGGDVSAAFIACLMGPTSPAADRWETLWHYSQSGPGVFMGDLVYYLADGDLRNVDLSALAAQRCPLYLLTGEYDLSATPALTAELAKQVNAVHFAVMPGLGHFPMSEAPERFLAHLRPVLARIRGQ